MSGRKGWTLSGRVTRSFAVTTSALVLVIAAVSALFLDASLERELAALLDEELDELSLGVPATAGTREDFADLASRLQAEHPANPMAFRVWIRDDDAPWAEFGVSALLADGVPAPQPGSKAARAPGGLRWRAERLPTGHLVGVVIDGSEQFRLLRQFGLLTLGLALLAGALAFLGGTLFVRRTCGLLAQVADQARAVRGPDSEVEIGVRDAPEEIRAVSDALAQMLANIRAETERARLLTAGMAHELGSPLQNLIGETQVALMDEHSATEYRALLESQLEELRDLARTVGNLVALCSVDEARSAQELEEFDLGEEVYLRLARERAHAARRSVELELAQEGDLRVRGDRESLLLAVSNLVSNAIDWSPTGGRVRAALEEVDPVVRVTVDDQGPGVPESERERVFEPFYRTPAAEGRRQGYGLGLSLARAAVAAHGGSLEISASPDGGARLRMELGRVARGEHA